MNVAKLMFDRSDIVRLIIVTGLSAYLVANKGALNNTFERIVAATDQPWINSPKPNASVKAGIVTFSGSGPNGITVEVLENGRIIAESVVKDNSWTAKGKLFGEGETKIFVRQVGGKSKASPAMPITVVGKVSQTTRFTNPIDADYITKGAIVLKGKGKPMDTLSLQYNGRKLDTVKVNSEGIWWKRVWIEFPAESGEFRARSEAEGEIATVYVAGPS